MTDTAADQDGDTPADAVRRPLEGIQVLELGQVISAPFAGVLLADLGAEIIKIEPPGTGDSSRNASVTPMEGESATFITFNRNKRSLALDLLDPTDYALFCDLARRADVVVSNMVPRVARKLRVDAGSLREINPRLVTCSIQGFRSDDPRRDEPTYDLTHQALAGYMAMEGRPGDPPLRVCIPIADLGAALFAVQGVLAGLVSRSTTGTGDHVEVPMYDSMLSLLTYTATMYLNTEKPPDRMGSEHEYVVPWQAVQASDGPFVLAVRSEKFWARLCRTLGRDDWLEDERFRSNDRRLAHRDEMRTLFDQEFGTAPVQHWLQLLRSVGVPAAPVRTVTEALDAAPHEAPDLIRTIPHSVLGSIRVLTNPLRFTHLALAPPGPPPTLDDAGPELRAGGRDAVPAPSSDPDVDVEAIATWLQVAAPNVAPPTKAWVISGGRSNLTYGLADELGVAYCLRRPPFGAATESAHDVLREHRILNALQGSTVPVPPVVAACSDTDVIGAPFFLTRFVDGVVCDNDDVARGLPEDARRAAGASLTSSLARIHGVDLQASGLATLSKFEGYVDRQVRRFRSQLSPNDLGRRPLLGEVADRLGASTPPQQASTLVHGDFKLGNCILAPSGEVAAVLDWELSTLGDPLADLGWLLASWSEPDDIAPRIVSPPTRAGGFDSREQIVASYARWSDLDLSSLPFYVALAEWKWACIDVGTYKRFAAGSMGGSVIDLGALDAEIDDRLARAAALLDGAL